MENPMKDEIEQTGTTGSMQVLLSHRYRIKRENNYHVVLETAQRHQRCERFEEAGNAFLKAAELAYSNAMEYISVVSSCEQAAECFLELKDHRALACIRKATDVYVENRHIEQGIEFIIRWGYKSGQKLGDTNKADELYQKADELRSEYKLSHTCVITKFVDSEFGRDVYQALKNAYHIYNQFEVKVKIYVGWRITHRSLCRYCIDAHQRLYSHILYLQNIQRERQINDAIEERKIQKQIERERKEEEEKFMDDRAQNN